MAEPGPASPGPSRRVALTGGAAALAGGAVALGVGVPMARRSDAGHSSTDVKGESGDPIESSSAVGTATEPFHGARQSGILTPPQAHAAFCAFDLEPRVTLAEVRGALRVWSQDAARLARGDGGLADLERELASGPARLTVTIGFGPSLFDRLRLVDRRPSWLAPVPAMPAIDRLEARWSGGDLLLQVCADDPLVVAHAVRVLGSGVRGVVTPRWVQRGFRRARGAQASSLTQRNLLGQVDGTVNPAADDPDRDRLLFSDGRDQPWMRGGSSLVLRRIAMDLDAWEQVDRTSRELAVGRRLDTGAPLTGTREDDVADFQAVDEVGLPVIPSESHMARAHQRTADEQILRRPYNYDEAPGAGRLSDSGLLFAAYQADPVRQFVPIQRRLAEKDSLNTWTTPVGSAVFALPPGAAEGEYVGQGLLGE